MLRRLELPHAAHHTLIEHARQRGIEFLSTPFDPQSLEFLMSLNLPRIKIGSGDLTNAPLLHSIAKAGMTLILSTGMATLGEVEEALGVLAHGYSGQRATARHCRFSAAWCDASGARTSGPPCQPFALYDGVSLPAR